MDYRDDGPRGIGGWLLVFLVILGLVTPGTSVIGTWGSLYGDAAIAAYYGTVWDDLQIAEWTVVGLTIAGCWAVLARMVSVRNWTSVKIAIAGIWLVGVGGNFAELLAVSLIAGISFPVLLGASGADLIRPFAFGAVWTAYLLKSVRVANTYPRHTEDKDVGEIFE